MRRDQIAKRPGAAPARSVGPDAPSRHDVAVATPGRDPLAELARRIAQDEAFATIDRNNNRSKQHREWPARRDESPASARAREGVPSNHGWDGDAVAQPVASGDIEGASGEPYDAYDNGDSAGPDDSNALTDRRRWFRMSAALIGLALAASAGALAYRAWTDVPVRTEEARAIGASTAAEKFIPPPQREDSRSDERPRAQSSVGENGGTVPSEEKPAGGQSAPPQALPSTSVPSGPAPAQVATVTSEAAPPDDTAAAENQPPPSNEAAASPTGLTATEANVGNGSQYIVQLSSQRSEAAAQATSRGLQAKYAGLFGGLQPFIRRSDLRDRGVYYRVLIGPFAAIGEANQLCGSLKKSGADCVVQKN